MLSAHGANSGLLHTETGNSIFLFNELGVIVGREGTNSGDAVGGDIVFTISVNANGDVTVTQFEAVKHDDINDHDEANDPAVDEPPVDDAAIQQTILNGLVSLEATITDGDGDTDFDFIELGALIRFEDDGPRVTATGTITLELDESIVDPATTGQEGGTIASGADDQALTQPNGLAPFGVTTADASGMFTVDFGSDDGTAEYSLIIRTERDNVSELTDISTTNFFATQPADGGNPDSNTGDLNPFTPYADPAIYLFQIDDQTIEGYVGAPNGSGDPTGPLALRMTINETTGVITLEQFLAIHHSDANDHDFQVTEPSNLLEGVLAKLTATDGDGDFESAEVPVAMAIEDDGPVRVAEGECIEIGDEPGGIANFVLVLDTSGSIESGQLALIKQNVQDFLQDIAGSGAQDVRVHIVGFDTNSEVVGTFDIIVGGDPKDGLGEALDQAIAAVNALVGGGSTNYEAGLAQANEWINGGTVTIVNAHSFQSDLDDPGDDDNTAYVLTDNNGVRIAVVSAWEPFASNQLDDVDSNSDGFGVNDDDDLDQTDEMLRFDFGAFTDFDGAGDFGRAGEAVGFRGSEVTSATFTLDDNNGSGDTVFAWTIYFVGGGSESGSQTVTNDEKCDPDRHRRECRQVHRLY